MGKMGKRDGEREKGRKIECVNMSDKEPVPILVKSTPYILLYAISQSIYSA
jgi:hypothetical protein